MVLIYVTIVGFRVNELIVKGQDRLYYKQSISSPTTAPNEINAVI